MAVYVSSDWHGFCPEGIQKLLQRVNFGAGDSLYVLGDVIDRGEHGIELLKFIMHDPRVTLIRGNHEDMLLSCGFLFDEELHASGNAAVNARLLHRWQSNGAEPTIAALLAEPSMSRNVILKYLLEAPLYAKVTVNSKNYILVHAGLGTPNRDVTPCPEDVSEEEMIWTRLYQTTVYSGDPLVIVGHTPTCIYAREYANRMLKTATWWDIDTGAACGYAPMLLCLDTRREYYLEKDGTVIER